ncbi:unnamed protein product [Mucor hiemalis]
MFTRLLSRTLLSQHTKLACPAVRRRAITTSISFPVTNKRLQPFKSSLRCFATIPPSVLTKQASTESGIDISEKAIKQLKIIQKREKDEQQMLRILVDSGGCHGYQNKMELTSTVDEEDTIFEKEGVKVVIDSVSLQFLRGSVVDYVQELIGSTFQVIDNPNAKHSCGCNISYDIDLDKIY